MYSQYFFIGMIANSSKNFWKLYLVRYVGLAKEREQTNKVKNLM